MPGHPRLVPGGEAARMDPGAAALDGDHPLRRSGRAARGRARRRGPTSATRAAGPPASACRARRGSCPARRAAAPRRCRAAAAPAPRASAARRRACGPAGAWPCPTAARARSSRRCRTAPRRRIRPPRPSRPARRRTPSAPCRPRCCTCRGPRPRAAPPRRRRAARRPRAAPARTAPMTSSWSVVSSPTMPMNCRMTPSEPERATTPVCTGRSPATIRSSVVLPAPLGPTSATLAPSPTRNDTSAKSCRPSGSMCATPATST